VGVVFIRFCAFVVLFLFVFLVLFLFFLVVFFSFYGGRRKFGAQIIGLGREAGIFEALFAMQLASFATSFWWATDMGGTMCKAILRASSRWTNGYAGGSAGLF